LLGRKGDVEVRRSRVELGQDFALGRDEPLLDKARPNGLGIGMAHRDFLLAVESDEPGEREAGDLAKGDAAIFLILGLQTAGEVVVAFVGDNHQLVDVLVKNTLAVLIDGKAQATTDFLSLASGGAALVERANLEDVRVIPALAQRRMAEDEPERLLHTEQPFLVLHDQVVNIVVGLCVAGGVLEDAFFVLGEIAVVQGFKWK
jgi:hypothetical protein